MKTHSEEEVEALLKIQIHHCALVAYGAAIASSVYPAVNATPMIDIYATQDSDSIYYVHSPESKQHNDNEGDSAK